MGRRQDLLERSLPLDSRPLCLSLSLVSGVRVKTNYVRELVTLQVAHLLYTNDDDRMRYDVTLQVAHLLYYIAITPTVTLQVAHLLYTNEPIDEVLHHLEQP